MALEQDIGGGAVQYWGQVLVTGAAARWFLLYDSSILYTSNE
jgi:hypothetical protein